MIGLLALLFSQYILWRQKRCFSVQVISNQVQIYLKLFKLLLVLLLLLLLLLLFYYLFIKHHEKWNKPVYVVHVSNRIDLAFASIIFLVEFIFSYIALAVGEGECVDDIGLFHHHHRHDKKQATIINEIQPKYNEHIIHIDFWKKMKMQNLNCKFFSLPSILTWKS